MVTIERRQPEGLCGRPLHSEECLSGPCNEADPIMFTGPKYINIGWSFRIVCILLLTILES
jgi:hypothetical protein